jgi:hypothetical protein
MKKLCLALALVMTIAFAEAQNVRKIAPNYYIAGLPGEKIERVTVDSRQKQENWCWAACIQTVLNYHDIEVTQEQIVNRSYGRLVNAPGGPRQMMRSLNGVISTPDGYKSVTSEFNSTSAKEIRNHLAQDNPLIVGLTRPGMRVGHAYVLSGLYYQTDKRGNIYPEKVVLRDPWPTSKSRVEMSWTEFVRRVNSVYEVSVKDYTGYAISRN